jgi:hypothetical protein
MFNDHILFSNNLNDAANQLRNIQLQKLEEERYKKLSVKLEEKINILENKLNYLIEEVDDGINLAALYMWMHGGVPDDAIGWSAADRIRFKQWWESLSDKQRRRYEEEFKSNEPFIPNSGKYIIPGYIPPSVREKIVAEKIGKGGAPKSEAPVPPPIN